MARRECSYGAEKLSPRQKNGSSDAEILCPRQKNGSSDAEIGISGQKTCSSDAEIGISGQKACSSAAVKHRPRLRTRIYATEIGIRHGRNNVRMMFEVKEVKEVIATLEVKDDTSAGETNGRTFVVNSVNFDNFDNFPLSFS